MKKICKDCGSEFTITQGEIEFYESKNFSLPQRCKSCRQKRKAGNQNVDKRNRNSDDMSLRKRKSEQTDDKRPKSNSVARTTSGRGYNNSTNYIDKSTVHKIAAVFLGLGLLLLLVMLDVGYIFPDKGQSNSQNVPYDSSYSDSDSSPQEDQVATGDSDSSLQEDHVATGDSDSSPQEDHVATGDSATSPSVALLQFRSAQYLSEHFSKHGDLLGHDSMEIYLAAANAVVQSASALQRIQTDGDTAYYVESTNEFVVVSTDGYIRTYFKPTDGIDYFNRQ